MSVVDQLLERFSKITEALRAPDRDALAAEREQLLLAPPQAPASMLEPAPLVCVCHTCIETARQEQERRLAWATWESRKRSVEAQLSMLTFGKDDDLDELGRQILALVDELGAKADEVRGREWAPTIERRADGRPIRARHRPADVNGRIAKELFDLRGIARNQMPLMGTTELTAAISAARWRMQELLAENVEEALDVKTALQIGPAPAPESEADRAGLMPAPGDPSVLGGTVRFKRGR